MPESVFSLKGRRVWVAGHRGMVGAAITRRLGSEDCEILTTSRTALDLRRQSDLEAWFRHQKPEVIFLAAATVGGIHANQSRPAEFIYDNVIIATNIIQAAWTYGVRKLLFLGSSCIYPRAAPQPMPEDCLLSGPLEPTNQWYALAKITGLKMCQAYRHQYDCDFISCMPTNLYGPGDSYDLENNHVVPALMCKAHEARMTHAPSMEVWGSGRPQREFLYAEDLADACVFLMRTYSDAAPINIGSGQECSIADLAHLMAEIVGFRGEIAFNTAMPDGTPRKRVDTRALDKLGWQATTSLREGLTKTYQAFQKDHLPPVRSVASGG